MNLMKNKAEEQKKITMNRNITNLFQYMCKNGHLEYAQHILNVHPTLDISAQNEYAFRFACRNGHLQVAQWLYQIKPTLDISAKYEEAFRWTCQHGHIQVAQWLYQIKPNINISAKNDWAFRWACLRDHIQVAQWIQSLYSNKYIIVVKNNQIINYTIIQTLLKSNTVLHLEQLEVCPICIELLCNLKTCCNHTFCESCIQTWFNNNKTCPYCRTCLENTLFQPITITATH